MNRILSARNKLGSVVFIGIFLFSSLTAFGRIQCENVFPLLDVGRDIIDSPNEFRNLLVDALNKHKKKSSNKAAAFVLPQVLQASARATIDRIYSNLVNLKETLTDSDIEKFLNLVEGPIPTMQQIRKDLKSDIVFINSIIQKNQPITYEELYLSSEAHAFLMQLRTSNRKAKTDGGLISVNWERRKEGYFQLIRYNELLNRRVPGFYIPSFAEFSVFDINQSFSRGLFVLGLTEQVARVDGQTKNSWNYFIHDLNHVAVLYSEPMFSSDSGRKKVLDISLKKEKIFLDSLFSEINSVKDENLKVLFNVILFEISHERGIPLHKDNLYEYLAGKEKGSAVSNIQELISARWFLEPKIRERLAALILYRGKKGWVDPFNNPDADAYLNKAFKKLLDIVESISP
jgi:hypothetical protein